jgi:AraC family transcriptional regulator
MDVAFLPTLSTYGRPVASRDLGGFAVSLSAHAPSETIPDHRHEDEYQWCLTLSGGFEETAARAREHCGAGSLLVRPRDCVHADRFDGVRGLCLNFFPRGDWLSERGLSVLADTNAHHRTRRLWRLGHALAGELHHTDATSPLAVESLMVELLTSAVRLRDLARRGHPQWLGAVVDRIESEPATELRLSVLARDAGVSAAHLARAFRAAFGRPLGTYVRERRIARATVLLRGSDRTLADVATDVGFCDQAHFTRAFKAQIGTTPAAFRRAD